MTIVFLMRLYNPHIGGVEKHVEGISKVLSRKHQIKVITERYDTKLPEYEKKDGIEIYRIPGPNKWAVWKWILQNQKMLNEADIIHAHDVYFWLFPYKLLHPFKKTFVTFHGWEGIYPIPWQNKLIRKISEILTTGNICVGDFIAKWYGTHPDFVTYGAA